MSDLTELIFDKICDELDQMQDSEHTILLSDFLYHLQTVVKNYNPIVNMYNIDPFVLGVEFHLWAQGRIQHESGNA